MTPQPPPSPADRIAEDLTDLLADAPDRGQIEIFADVRELRALLSDHARLVEEIGRLREAATALLSVVDAFHDFCHDPKRPCGEYGVECPIGMGEWVETADKDAVARARAALSPRQKEGGT